MRQYVRFARALALVSGLGACGSSATPAPTTPRATSTPPESNGNGDPTVVSPSPTPTPVVTPMPYNCDCGCGSEPGRISCVQTGHFDECCGAMVIEGPLPPPDLPA